jgi:MoaA/NifB/PqqE/SkfB family radical SAM enzyme
MVDYANKNERFFWRRLFPRPCPRWDWIQVEVTSDCNAACEYCPRTAYRDRWTSRTLPLETFRGLQPFLNRAAMVHLQGWGEPLLHPDFFTLIDLAKAAGCRVGTTTNGTLLDTGRITRLMDSGMDTIALSLAGTGPRNDRIRRGTRLERVLEAIQDLNREKKKRGSRKPAVHVAYLLLRSGIAEVSQLPFLLRDLGVDQVVVSTLDFTPRPELEAEAIRPSNQREYQELNGLLGEVSRTGESLGLPIHFHLPHPQPTGRGCTENIERAVCVASDGSVTPCVFTNLSIPGETVRLHGETRPYSRLVFGNIGREALSEIWWKQEYVDFRKAPPSDTSVASCRECPKRLS